MQGYANRNCHGNLAISRGRKFSGYRYRFQQTAMLGYALARDIMGRAMRNTRPHDRQPQRYIDSPLHPQKF